MKNATIKNITAGFLLLLFAFSITPKQVLHDWVAHHKDSIVHPSTECVVKVGNNGFNCNCDNLVAESPFMGQDSRIHLVLPLFFTEYIHQLPGNNCPSDHFIYGLRGPPAIA